LLFITLDIAILDTIKNDMTIFVKICHLNNQIFYTSAKKLERDFPYVRLIINDKLIGFVSYCTKSLSYMKVLRTEIVEYVILLIHTHNKRCIR
jgi:hypothetical protein